MSVPYDLKCILDNNEPYKIYSAFIKMAGSISKREFLTWWRIIPPRSRRNIKNAWYSHLAGRNKVNRKAYSLYHKISETGIISEKDFKGWWNFLDGFSANRVLLYWWGLIEQGCQSCRVFRTKSSSVLEIRIAEMIFYI